MQEACSKLHTQVMLMNANVLEQIRGNGKKLCPKREMSFVPL